MSNDEEKKARTLSKDAKAAALEQAAAMLTAIHTAKQVSAEVLSTRGGSGPLNPLNPNVRLPLGDILFGVAQIQVDFARRLFEFNRNASVVLRDRMRKNHSYPPEKQTVKLSGSIGEEITCTLKIKNSASLSRTFNFRVAGCGINVKLEKESVTIATRDCVGVKVTFCGDMPDTYTGEIAVESHGLQVELIPFTVVLSTPSTSS